MGATAVLFLLVGSRHDAQAQTGSQNAAFIRASHPSHFSRGHVSIPPETMTGRVKALNGFAWKYGYDIQVKDHRLFVRVAINFIPARGLTRPELERVKPLWKETIERIWSNKFALVTHSGRCYPMVIDISFKGPKFNHEVIIHPGRGRSDQLNWKILNSPEIAAHEFGHMLGAFDEYRRGAVSPRCGIIDKTSIMTNRPTEGRTYARHYKGFLEWFSERTGLKDMALVSMDGLKRQYAEF